MKKTKRFYDFFGLTETEIASLKNRIARWNGTVRVFVHPMYEKWRGNESKYINDPSQAMFVQIERVLARLLTMSEDKTPPIIIMEEEDFIENLDAWLRRGGPISLKNDVYVVKTRESNPTPSLKGLYPSESWKPLIDVMHKVGVKKILIGGIELNICPYSAADWTGR